ncbi:MAG: hypothetical protein PHO15_01795 [Eubacteriales bacterium]|nr:hypothetical protein [Eubacteriales bacterium]
MESIQRSLMLLKPGGGRLAEHGKNGGTLKLQSTKNGLVLTFITDCLKPGDYGLYLFSKDGKEFYAGDIRDGGLNATLYDIALGDIACAAVVSHVHQFCLKSAGIDWPAVIERFKLSRADSPAPNTQSEKTVHMTTEDGAQTQKYAPVISQNMYTQEIADSGPSIDNNENDDKNDICGACPHVIRQDKINPFPSVFPQSEWVKISYPGPTGWWHYISGRIYKDSTVVAKVLGVPGEYGMAPPIWLEGFGTYMRCVTGDARGYWLMFQDAETGEVLDMGLSPRDG